MEEGAYAVEVSDHIMIAHSFKGEVFGPAQAVHGATFVVAVAFMADDLDKNGIVVDIGRAFEVLKETLAPINYKNLDDLPEFKGKNTTTEFLTRYVFDKIAAAVKGNKLGRNGRDRRQLSWQGVSVDLRYRFLERDEAPFGFTFAVEGHANRVDETTAAVVRSYGTEFALAFDRELVPNVAVAALNLIYQPEWTRVIGTGAAEQESTIGAALGLMVQARPGLFLGGEARYLRQYEGIGLEEFAGQALFVGPTAYSSCRNVHG